MIAAVVTKVWMVGLPIVWLLKVDRKSLGWSRPKLGGFGLSLASGILISAVIVCAYGFIGQHWIDAAFMRKSVATGEPPRTHGTATQGAVEV